MERLCNVCASPLGPPIYRSRSATSLTSLCTLRPGPTENYFCAACGHAQTQTLDALDHFYADEYKILLATDEEDQLYATIGGKTIYRTEHQLTTLLELLTISPGGRVLDFGSAKGAMARAVATARPDLTTYLFDVSEHYLPFWQRWLPAERYATRQIPDHWFGTFDVVMSFFVLEHIPDLAAALQQVYALLRPGGSFYFLVPNMYANIADFVVVDHANHFSRTSLERLLSRQRFQTRTIDSTRHQSAFVVHGIKTEPVGTETTSVQEIDELQRQVAEMAVVLEGFSARTRAFEEMHANAKAAVYGSGFYGAYLTTLLKRPENIHCYVDQNPHRQGQQLFGKPIVGPHALSPDIHALYVGLNPRVARDAIAAIAEWSDRQLEYLYL